MKRVMIVEDEELIRRGIECIFDWEKLGMQIVHTAANGREALALFLKEPVDVIITDINMPVMDGLAFLKEVREKDKRVRVILLTGYDEFEYARRAISLDVEDYILKPINEEKLEEVVKAAGRKLEQAEREQAEGYGEKAGWLNFLLGNLSEEEAEKYIEILPRMEKEVFIYPAIMKLSLESLGTTKITDILIKFQEEKKLRVIYLSADSLLLLVYANESEEEILRYFGMLQNELETSLFVRSFISMGNRIIDHAQLQKAYAEAKKLQKYQIIEGYGSCVMPKQIKNRKSTDMTIDPTVLRKLVFKKDKVGAFDYLEDLFINNVKDNADADDIYRMALKTAMILQEIKEEYYLEDKKNMHNMTELVERIYNAEDLSALKMIFNSEIMEIITCISEEDSHYTPVVKQIMAEVSKNYAEDMNLKTLSYKYNMNASYLGQIFQKEVGCSFAQYLSNTKNSIAKDMILNTNMRINDIAKAVGYPDTSYFYRKFKQCYGVSPASLREMKQY